MPNPGVSVDLVDCDSVAVGRIVAELFSGYVPRREELEPRFRCDASDRRASAVDQHRDVRAHITRAGRDAAAGARNRDRRGGREPPEPRVRPIVERDHIALRDARGPVSVSYTHLTLP